MVNGVGGADVWMEVWAIGDGVSGQWSRESVVRMYGWRCGQWAMESVVSGQGSRGCGCIDGGVWIAVLAAGDGVSGQWSRESVVRMYRWRCMDCGVGSRRWSQWSVVKGVGGADVWMEVWAAGDGDSGQWSRELRVRMYRWGCMD